MISDIEGAVRQLGLVVAKTTERELVCACPAHEERTGHRDTNPSLWVNREHGQFLCRSCQFKGPFEALVRYMVGDGEDAQRFQEKSGDLERALAALTASTEQKKPEPARIFPEALLERFTAPPPDALEDRHLTAEAAADYGILWHADSRMWVLPIRNGDGELLGFQAKGAHRYFMYPKGLKKADALFGPLTDTVVLIESPLDAARIASAGISGAVATFGTSITAAQLARIFCDDNRTVVLALDNDTSGRLATREILKKFEGKRQTVLLYEYGDSTAKDPGEQSDAEIHSGIRNAMLYMQWLMLGRTL